MATHSSILFWRIPWTKEPGGLESIRSQRVRLQVYVCRSISVLNINSCILFVKFHM